MRKKRLLISFAHPDDESFGLGAAIPKWIDDGVDVYLICATNGDVGNVPPALQGKYPSVAALRLSELQCARRYLHFADVFMLGYRDSGMPGSETSRHPESLCYQWAHHPQTVTDKALHVMRQVEPQVVVTFNRYGGYGHPDHIAIQRATTAAFHQLRADESAGSPQKLYYAAVSQVYGVVAYFAGAFEGAGSAAHGLKWRCGYHEDPGKHGTGACAHPCWRLPGHLGKSQQLPCQPGRRAHQPHFALAATRHVPAAGIHPRLPDSRPRPR